MPDVSGTRRVDNHPGIYSYDVKLGPPNRRTRYAAVVTVSRRQRWLRGFKTIKAAEEAADALRVEMRSGQAGTAPARYTLAEYLDNRWFPFAKASVRATTIEAYASSLKHVKHYLGARRLTSLSPIDIEDFKQAMAADGLGHAAANGAYLRLNQALAQAVTWRLLGNNPCGPIAAPKMPKYRAPSLPVEQVQRLLEKAEQTDFGALFLLACMTGLRWGELQRLTWSDVDFAQATLRVMESKTETGVRTIALGADTIERLQQHRIIQMRYAAEMGGPPPTRVFIRPNGQPLHDLWFYRHVWYDLREAIGLPKMHFHDLRHVHASLMARAKVHPKVAAERMGHTDVRLTLNTYTQIDAEQQREAAEALETIIRLAQT